MNSKDKNSLITLGILTGLVVYSIFSAVITQYIPYKAMALGVLASHHLVFVPLTSFYYHKFYEKEPKFTRFIPFYNSFELFPKYTQIITIVCIFVGALLGLAVLLIPVDAITSILGQQIGSSIYQYYGTILFILLMIVELQYSLGLWSWYRKISKIKHTVSNTSKKNRSVYLYLIITFVPVIRVIALTSMYNDIRAAVGFSKYTVTKVRKESKRLEKGSY